MWPVPGRPDLHRFYFPDAATDAGAVRLPAEIAHQVSRVLRMRVGDRIAVFDDSGAEWILELDEVGRSGVAGRVVAEARPGTEASVAITLVQALLDPAQFELVLQKGTELGVATFVPLLTGRVAGSASTAPSARRHSRWQKIIQEAAEQSGRVRIPALARSQGLEAACEAFSAPAFVLWEEESSTGLRTALRRIPGPGTKALTLIVGPKGGFPSAEIAALKASGAVPVSIGASILRAETAAVAAVSAVMYELGQLGD